MIFYYITDHLTFISSLSFRINESQSQKLIQLNWNEPFMDLTYSGNVVDIYTLEINAMTINTTEPMVNVVLPNNITDIDVGVSARNCLGLSPTTTFRLTILYQGTRELCSPSSHLWDDYVVDTIRGSLGWI